MGLAIAVHLYSSQTTEIKIKKSTHTADILNRKRMKRYLSTVWVLGEDKKRTHQLSGLIDNIKEMLMLNWPDGL